MTAPQIDANRQNARKSTGPRTTAGKANSSRNATKHGLSADLDNPFIPGDDPAQFQPLLDDHFTRFRPVGPAEELLVRRIAAAQWRLGRAFAQEAAIYRQSCHDVAKLDDTRQRAYDYAVLSANHYHKPLPLPLPDALPGDLAGRAFLADCSGANALTKLARYETTLERSIDRCLRQLTAYQAARAAAEAALPVAEPAPAPTESADCKTNPRNDAVPRPAPESQPDARQKATFCNTKPDFEPVEQASWHAQAQWNSPMPNSRRVR